MDGWKHGQDGWVSSRMFSRQDDLTSMTTVGHLPSMRNFLTSPLEEEAGGLIPWILILQTVSFSPAHQAAPSLRVGY